MENHISPESSDNRPLTLQQLIEVYENFSRIFGNDFFRSMITFKQGPQEKPNPAAIEDLIRENIGLINTLFIQFNGTDDMVLNQSELGKRVLACKMGFYIMYSHLTGFMNDNAHTSSNN